MAYTQTNYRTKKALKEAVAAGQEVRCFNPGLGPDLDQYTGMIYLEGPWFPEPHRWYAKATLVRGVIREIK